VINLLILIFQWIAIISFFILSILEAFKNPVDFNAFIMNFSLVLLYVSIYLKPFK